jgi:tetratricopeptide (TPR) repeat protein
VPAIHGYAKTAKEQPSSAADLALISIRWVCSDVFGYKNGEAIQAGGPSWAQDELCRRIFTVWFLTAGNSAGWSVNGKSVNGIQWWLETVENATPPGAVIADADFLAWAAYLSGQLDTAARWLKMADSSQPIAQWLQAKLLLRDGKVAEAEKTLSNLEQSSAAKEITVAARDQWDFPTTVPLEKEVSGELGLFKLAKRDYPGALDSFWQAARYSDGAYVAELVMTRDELEAYASKVAASAEDHYWSIRSVCAHRLAREGFWDQAVPFFQPEQTIAAQQIADFMQIGRDKQKPAQQRANDLFNAAELIFKNPDFVRAQIEPVPDWKEDPGFHLYRLDWKERLFAPSQDELARVKRHTAPPLDRFSNRLIAANLMWECAKLLPDNDIETARALYMGGTYIAARRPERADKFYKALVRRNPKLPIAQEAEKLRWFPPQFIESTE